MQIEFKETEDTQEKYMESFAKEEIEMAHVFEAKKDVNEHWNRILKIKFHANGVSIEIRDENKTNSEYDDINIFHLSNEFNSLLGHTFLDYAQKNIDK